MNMNSRHIGKYELQEHLAHGIVGEIWKAFDTSQHHFVTIKVIPVNTEANAEFTPRFYREAQILASLHHPDILSVQDFRMSQNGSEAYVIMDYVEGETLADYINATAHVGKIPTPTEIMSLLTPVADALDYAHQHNVIHGALKPSVILIGKVDTSSSLPKEEVKLTDFGMNYIQNPLALSLDNVPYVSPEIAQGHTATSRSDLYSLGVILYEMCTGALPFQGDTSSDILMQHIHGIPTSPALINPHITPALTAAIMRSLARDPAARYSTATALVVTVAKALNTQVPEMSGLAHPSPDVVNPPSLSGIHDTLDTIISPTYSTQLPQQSVPPGQPVVAGSSNAGWQPAPVISPVTPVLPITPTGPMIPSLPAQYASTTPISQPSPAVSAGPPQPVTIAAPSAPVQVPAQTGLAPTPVSKERKRRPGWLYIGLVAALLVMLASSVLGIYIFTMRNAPPPPSPIVGHAFFVSSGLLSDFNSNQGITDELQINLQNIPDQQPGKSYYAWLLSNQIDLPAVVLGALPLKHGQVSMTYSDPQHNNLLASYNRFLITEEATNPPPTNPSVDSNTWRYSAIFSTTPNPADTINHFSLYDHLRHLLSQDPKLNKVGLKGGLDIWLYKNTEKILEQAGSARDAQKQCTSAPTDSFCDYVRRAMIRILDFLDGSTYVQLDAPGSTLGIAPDVARVALLEFDPVKQQPPGYLEHIGNHLREITTSPGVTSTQLALANRIEIAINNVQSWLQAVRADAAKLEQMNNSELSNASPILNDLFTQANYAFVGHFDPDTGTVMEGVVQIHYNIQGLATFDVTPCTINNGRNSCS